MTRPEHATGDSIAQELNGRKPGDSLADVAKDLTDAHNHRPGLFDQDLAKVNEKLHDQGILPEFTLIGVKGQDLVAKDSSGNITLIDATKTDRTHTLKGTDTDTSLNGRDAKLNPDGSGQVTVKQGDTPWSISEDVLKKQGIDNPTPTQIANYIKELDRLNGKHRMAHLRPGDPVNLPPATVSGDQTDFTSERANDQLTGWNADLQKQVDAAKQVIKDLHYDGVDWNANINKGEIADALSKPDLTDDQRKALQFLDANFDQLKNTGAFVNSTFMSVFGRGDSIWMGGLDQYEQDQEEKLAERALHNGL